MLFPLRLQKGIALAALLLIAGCQSTIHVKQQHNYVLETTRQAQGSDQRIRFWSSIIQPKISTQR